MGARKVSFLYGLITHRLTSNPGKKVVLENFAGDRRFPFLNKTEVRVLLTDAMSTPKKKYLEIITKC